MVREEKMFCTIFKKSPEEERAFQVLRGVDSTKMELGNTKRELEDTKKELNEMRDTINTLSEEVAKLKELVSSNNSDKTVTKSGKK